MAVAECPVLRLAQRGVGRVKSCRDIPDTTIPFLYLVSMPSRLKRYQDTKRDSHFITFSRYKRQPFLICNDLHLMTRAHAARFGG